MLSNDLKEATTALYDMTGKLKKSVHTSVGEVTLPIYDLEGGVYLLKAFNGRKQYQSKLVIQK